MKNWLSTALVAAISYIFSNLVYGKAEFADVGVTVVPATYMTAGIPTTLSLVWFLIKNGFPKFGATVDKILKIISLGKVGLLNPAPKTSTTLLNLLNQLEMEAASLGIPAAGTEPVRKAALEKLKP